MKGRRSRAAPRSLWGSFARIVEDDLGVEKLVVPIADLDLLPFLLAARIADGRKIGATVERLIADGRDGVGDDDACKAFATVERQIADGRDGVGDDDACKAAAILKCPTANCCNGVGDDDACKAAATVER